MVQIVDLASLPRRARVEEQLAEWHVGEWGHLYDPAMWNPHIALAELRAMAPRGVPRTLVALDDTLPEATPVGSVSLLATDDLPGWEGIGPWLGSLFVTPPWRGRGIGGELVEACLQLARSL